MSEESGNGNGNGYIKWWHFYAMVGVIYATMWTYGNQLEGRFERMLEIHNQAPHVGAATKNDFGLLKESLDGISTKIDILNDKIHKLQIELERAKK